MFSDMNKSQRWSCVFASMFMRRLQRFLVRDTVKICGNAFISWAVQTGRRVENPNGSSSAGGDNCPDSEQFDLLSSQMLNRLTFRTLFTLNRSILYCISVRKGVDLAFEHIWVL